MHALFNSCYCRFSKGQILAKKKSFLFYVLLFAVDWGINLPCWLVFAELWEWRVEQSTHTPRQSHYVLQSFESLPTCDALNPSPSPAGGRCWRRLLPERRPHKHTHLRVTSQTLFWWTTRPESPLTESSTLRLLLRLRLNGFFSLAVSDHLQTHTTSHLLLVRSDSLQASPCRHAAD